MTGIVETRQFNARNQLTRIAAAANGATLLDLGYGYGANNSGRIRSRTDAVQPEHSTSYTYDELYRLENVTGGDSSWGIAWTLDQYGNRTTQTPTGLASSRLGSPSLAYADNKVSGLGYDATGNMTNDGVGGHNYTYDAENRLVQVDSSAIQYAYDYAGRRIKKTVGSTTTYYFYGLTGLMSEFSTSTSPSNATQAASTDRIQYRVGEQTGTAVMLVGSDGTPRENNRVFPFGEPWLASVASNNSEKFTTYQRDGESGLEYAMARYYAGGTGRFMTPDPGHIGAVLGDPQTWNAYIYVASDPINAIDPTGTVTDCPSGWWCDPDLIAFLFWIWGKGGTIQNPPEPPPGPPVGPPASQTVPKKNEKSELAVAKEWVCSAIPDGRTVGLTGAIGLHGGGTGSVEIVLNYNTGELSAFASGGLFGGVNGGASGGPFAGLIYGLGNSNANFSKGFSGVAVSAPGGIGGFIESSSESPQNPFKLNLLTGPKVIAASWTPSVLTGGTNAMGTATYASPPLSLGHQFLAYNTFDSMLFTLRKLC
jgi:RHS repeat-associated protein